MPTLIFLNVFFKNLCVLFFCILGELFKYVIYITDFILCVLALSFPGSNGNFISLPVFFFFFFPLWFPYILSYINGSTFNSVPYSTYLFHFIIYLCFLSLSFKNRGHIFCSLWKHDTNAIQKCIVVLFLVGYYR